MTIRDDYSPNQSARPTGISPSLIVWHATVGTDAGDLSWLKNPAAGVSYHYLIQRTGQIHRLVRPERKAWHAGVSSWQGRANVNDFSIGIGLSNLGNGELYTGAQYRSAGWLAATLMRHFPITMRDNVGHYHVAPGRKTDPFYTFEWMRLTEEILLAQEAGAALKAA